MGKEGDEVSVSPSRATYPRLALRHLRITSKWDSAKHKPLIKCQSLSDRMSDTRQQHKSPSQVQWKQGGGGAIINDNYQLNPCWCIIISHLVSPSENKSMSSFEGEIIFSSSVPCSNEFQSCQADVVIMRGDKQEQDKLLLS